MNSSAVIGSAFLACLLTTGAAVAAEAVGSANVRSGPGVGYGVVDQLSPGENVRVDRCAANGWCLVSHDGPDGWVSAKLLADNGDEDDYFNADGSRQVAAEDDTTYLEDEPKANVHFGIGFNFGNGFMMGRPGRGDLVCLVTFFKRADVAAGADADVQRAQVLPRRVAEARDRRNDRRAIFDYGTDRQTIETCNYLDDLN